MLEERRAIAPSELTPVEEAELPDGRGRVWLKREDAYSLHGVSGSKVRAAYIISEGAAGIVTQSSRHGQLAARAAAAAKERGIPCRAHVPEAAGPLTPELELAESLGAELVGHRPGYMGVLKRRAWDDASERQGWVLLRLGAESSEAVNAAADQTENIPDEVRRIVCVAGSGVNLAGIVAGLWGSNRLGLPILAVTVGMRPEAYWRYTAFLAGLRLYVTWAEVELPFERRVEATLGSAVLDPHYEAKALPYLRDGDLFWIVAGAC